MWRYNFEICFDWWNLIWFVSLTKYNSDFDLLVFKFCNFFEPIFLQFLRITNFCWHFHKQKCWKSFSKIKRESTLRLYALLASPATLHLTDNSQNQTKPILLDWKHHQTIWRSKLRLNASIYLEGGGPFSLFLIEISEIITFPLCFLQLFQQMARESQAYVK